MYTTKNTKHNAYIYVFHSSTSGTKKYNTKQQKDIFHRNNTCVAMIDTVVMKRKHKTKHPRFLLEG